MPCSQPYTCQNLSFAVSYRSHDKVEIFEKLKHKLCSENSKIISGQSLMCTKRGMLGTLSRDIRSYKRLKYQICCPFEGYERYKSAIPSNLLKFFFQYHMGLQLLLYMQCTCMLAVIECLDCFLRPIVDPTASLPLGKTIWSMNGAFEDVPGRGKKSDSMRIVTERIRFKSNCRTLDSCRDAQTARASIEHEFFAIRPNCCRCKCGVTSLLLYVQVLSAFCLP